MSLTLRRKYGEETTITFSLVDPDGVDFATGAVHASGDTKIVSDDVVEANTTNGFVDNGTGYALTLTEAEMTNKRIHLFVIDQGTKAWLDRDIVIETYGHADAQHDTTLWEGIPATHSGVTSDLTLNTITLETGASTTNGFYNNQQVIVTDDNGLMFVARITSYNGASLTATLRKNFASLPTVPVNYLILADDDDSTSENNDVATSTRAEQTTLTDLPTVGMMVNAFAPGSIDLTALSADMNVYQAKTHLLDDEANGTEYYVTIWYKNGTPIVADITDPLIQVYSVVDGSDLISENVMFEIATTGTFKYTATDTEQITAGEPYIAKVSATIDGAIRTEYTPVGRDSTL